MSFKIQSHIESQPKDLSENESYTSRKMSSWVNEKGYFCQERVLEAIDHHLRDKREWPGNGKFAQATFDRMCGEGGQGISSDKFIAEFDSVVDTKRPDIRQALGTVKELLAFFGHFPFAPSADVAEALDYSGFLRALSSHAEINPLFNIDCPQLKSAVRNGHDGYKVNTDPPKTSSDLRRLLFRSIASPLPHSEGLTDRTHLPVLQFVWHEHEQGADGQSVNVEHRIFELEDERTIELQDLLAMSKTRLIDTRLEAPFSRDEYREAVKQSPGFKHDLQQLGIKSDRLVTFVSLISTIDPQVPGFRTIAGEGGSFDTQLRHWRKALGESNEYVEYEQFDKLLKTQSPHFYIQLSKLIGLLMVERSADGGYAGETDPEKIELPPADVMQYRLRMFTASERFDCRELEESFLLDTTDVTKPLHGGCVKCWDLKLVDDEEQYSTG